jgi:14-3-3 protein epsilon
MADHDDIAFRVRLYHELGRSNDAISNLDALIAASPVLNEADRHLFSCVYKAAFDSLRQSVRHLRSIYEAELEEGHIGRSEKLREYQNSAFRDLDFLCERALTTITDHLIPSSPDITATAFYHKFQGDICRYHAECAPQSQVQRLLEKAKLNYDKSLEICATALPLRHPLRLGVILNNAVFQYEHLHRKADGRELIQGTLAEIEANPASEAGENESEIQQALEVMRENFERWGVVDQSLNPNF